MKNIMAEAFDRFLMSNLFILIYMSFGAFLVDRSGLVYLLWTLIVSELVAFIDASFYFLQAARHKFRYQLFNQKEQEKPIFSAPFKWAVSLYCTIHDSSWNYACLIDTKGNFVVYEWARALNHIKHLRAK